MSLKLDADYNHMNINTESSRISFSRNTRSRALCVRANQTEKTLPWSRFAEADDAGGEVQTHFLHSVLEPAVQPTVELAVAASERP